MAKNRNSEAAGVASVTPAASSSSSTDQDRERGGEDFSVLNRLQKQIETPREHRPIQEILNSFLAEIQAHPDAKLLVLERSGTPTQQQALRHLPTTSQTYFNCKLLVKR